MAEPTARQVAAANVALHSKLADTYDQDEPHFKPENLERVDAVSPRLQAETRGGALLDVGCGTGFVINLAKRHFQRVIGVDITPAMIRRVNRSGGWVRLGLANAEEIPVRAGQFDVATAYSFLHHLMRVEPTLREMARALRPGGILYTELDPNWYFWQAMKEIPEGSTVSAMVRREIDGVLHKDDELGGKTGVTEETVRLAEYVKSVGGGVREEDVVPMLRRLGFADIRFEYQWFLGQGAVMHGHPQAGIVGSFDVARRMDEHLRACLPVSRGLYKYVGITAVKER